MGKLTAMSPAGVLLCLTLLVGVPAPSLADPMPATAAVPNREESPLRKPLRIVSQGGAYQQSQALAFFEAFTREKGIPIEIVPRPKGPLNAEAAQTFDLIDLPVGQAMQACQDGLLEKLDAAVLLGEDAGKDFVPGALSDCAVGSTVWSAFFVYNRPSFIDRRLPTSILDVFDLARQPGKRIFPRSPRYLLEAALLADQVAPSQIYKVLETSAGVTRAFQKIERIKEQIVWFDRPADAIRLLQAPDTSFALTSSGRAFMAAVQDRVPLNIMWNAQIYDVNVWAIAKDTKRLFDARDFIRFALDPRRLASQTRWFPYGPARLSSAAFVGKNASVDMDMSPWLPTTPPNLKNALRFNAAFWAINEETLTERFNAWADGKIDAAGAVPLTKPDPGPKGKAPAKPR